MFDQDQISHRVLCKNIAAFAASFLLRLPRDIAQRRQKDFAINAMLATRVIDGVEGRDRATDATHFEVEKNTDCRRVAPHHLVHQIIELDRHWEVHPFWMSIGQSRRRSLSGGKLPRFSRETAESLKVAARPGLTSRIGLPIQPVKQQSGSRLGRHQPPSRNFIVASTATMLCRASWTAFTEISTLMVSPLLCRADVVV